MVVWVVEFSSGGRGNKLEIFLLKNQHDQRKSLNFENWCSGKLSNIGQVILKLMLSKMSITKNVLK